MFCTVDTLYLDIQKEVMKQLIAISTPSTLLSFLFLLALPYSSCCVHYNVLLHLLCHFTCNKCILHARLVENICEIEVHMKARTHHK